MSALLEKILSRDNMFAALDKVKANKGAGGIDGISVDEIDQYLKENWVDIRDKIRRRKYKPKPVRRVEIPKPNVHGRARRIRSVRSARSCPLRSRCPASSEGRRASPMGPRSEPRTFRCRTALWVAPVPSRRSCARRRRPDRTSALRG